LVTTQISSQFIVSIWPANQQLTAKINSQNMAAFLKKNQNQLSINRKNLRRVILTVGSPLLPQLTIMVSLPFLADNRI
jgi:hypothetical protein